MSHFGEVDIPTSNHPIDASGRGAISGSLTAGSLSRCGDPGSSPKLSTSFFHTGSTYQSVPSHGPLKNQIITSIPSCQICWTSENPDLAQGPPVLPQFLSPDAARPSDLPTFRLQPSRIWRLEGQLAGLLAALPGFQGLRSNSPGALEAKSYGFLHGPWWSKPMGWSPFWWVGEFTHFRTYLSRDWDVHWGYGLNPVPLVNIKIGGKWMFTHPKMEP